jgi:hypothetical protein
MTWKYQAESTSLAPLLKGVFETLLQEIEVRSGLAES